jgi:hypothetical protein
MASNSLPNEILAQICSYLCFHCRNPGIFPNSNTTESRIDKITLARMCRASKMLCSIAQPALFHYYASGNLARSVRTDFQKYKRSWNNVNKLIAKVPIIDVAAMDLVWPPSIEQEIDLFTRQPTY